MYRGGRRGQNVQVRHNLSVGNRAHPLFNHLQSLAKKHPERLGSLAIALAAGIWGLWVLVIRQTGLSGPVVACIVMFALGTFTAPMLPRRLPRGWAMGWPLLATGVTDAGNALLYYEALARGPVAVAVLSHYLAPVLVAVFAPFLLGQRASKGVWLGLAVSLVGLLLLLGGDALQLDSKVLTTALLGAASAVFYALQTVIQKRAGDRLTGAEMLVWHAWLSGLILLPFALMQPMPHWQGVAWLCGGAIVGGTFAGTVFLWGLRRVSAAKAGVLTYLEPVVGVAAGVFVLGETMPALAPLGALLILVAGIWVVRE